MAQNFSELAYFLWSVADLLRGDYKQADYGKVILPFTLLRRAELSGAGEGNGARPVLRRTPKGDAYMFVDPQYRMAIRAMLRIGEKQTVEKIPWTGSRLQAASGWDPTPRKAVRC